MRNASVDPRRATPAEGSAADEEPSPDLEKLLFDAATSSALR
jgi:hypothetical protein